MATLLLSVLGTSFSALAVICFDLDALVSSFSAQEVVLLALISRREEPVGN